MRTLSYWACLCLTLSAFAVGAVELDPAYLARFGAGKVVVSGKGALAKDKLDASLVELKGDRFLVSGGPSGKLYFRVLLPKGETLGSLVDKAKKANPSAAKYATEGTTAFRVWCSHDRQGNELAGAKWPAALTDVPTWSAPVLESLVTVEGERSGWTTQGIRWEEDMQSSLGPLLSEARPGWKLYVAYYVGFTSKSPAGTIENKWDPDKRKFVPVPSVGLLSRNLGTPVAAATVEIAGAAVAPGGGWTFKVDAMPAQQDGAAEGRLTVLKGGAEKGKCKVRINLAYTEGTGVGVYDISFEMVGDESKRGGFRAKAAKVEGALQNAFGQFAARELGE